MSPATFKVVPRRTTWIAGDRVVADVVLANTGDETLEVPAPSYPPSQQPVYVLEGPEGRATFTPRALAGIDEDLGPLLLRLAPGETWEGDVLIGARPPGSYRLGATIEWRGTRLEAPRAAFEVVDARLSQLAIARTSRAPGMSLSFGHAIQTNPRSLGLAAVLFRERVAHYGEVGVEGPEVWGALPQDTLGLLSTVASFDAVRQPLSWFGAITPRGIQLGNNLSPHTTLVRAARPIRALPEALAFADGSLLVVAVLAGPGGAELATASLPHPEKCPAEVELVVVERLGPGHRDIATAVGHGSESALVATTSGAADGTRVEVRRFDRAGRASEPMTVEIARERPEPGLAAIVGAGGVARVLVVTRDLEAPGTRTVSWVEGPLEGGELRRTSSARVENVALLPEPLVSIPALARAFELEPGRGDGVVVFLPREEVLPPVAWTSYAGSREAPELAPLRSGGGLFPGRGGCYAAWIHDGNAVDTSPV